MLYWNQVLICVRTRDFQLSHIPLCNATGANTGRKPRVSNVCRLQAEATLLCVIVAVEFASPWQCEDWHEKQNDEMTYLCWFSGWPLAWKTWKSQRIPKWSGKMEKNQGISCGLESGHPGFYAEFCFNSVKVPWFCRTLTCRHLAVHACNVRYATAVSQAVVSGWHWSLMHHSCLRSLRTGLLCSYVSIMSAAAGRNNAVLFYAYVATSQLCKNSTHSSKISALH